MYAACTSELVGLVHMDALGVVARVFAYLAIGLWLIAFAGLVRHLAAAVV
jgi:hypothetical protein